MIIILLRRVMIIQFIHSNINQIGYIPYRNSINIYDYAQENIIFEKNLENKIPWIEALYCFRNDNRIILSYSGFFSVFSSKIEEIKKISIDNEIPKFFLEINDGDLIVAFNNQIFIYDKNFIFKLKLIGHSNNISGLIKINENLLLSYSTDSNIKLWNLTKNGLIESFNNIENKINSIILIGNNCFISSFNIKGYYIEKCEVEFFTKD